MAARGPSAGLLSQLLSLLGMAALVMAVVVLATGWVPRLWGPPVALLIAGACFWGAARTARRGSG